MRRRPSGVTVFVSSVCLLGCLLSGPSAGAEERLTVLTFNIRYGTAKDEGHSWDSRRDAVVRLIQESFADFVGLQESLAFQNDFIRKGLGSAYVMVGEGREGGSRGEFGPIFYRSDRYTLVRAGRFWLSNTPDKIGSRSWSSLPRMVTWIEVLSNSSSDRILVLNTHFSHVSDDARSRGAELILRKLKQDIRPSRDTSVVLMGDFNSPPDSRPHQILAGPDGGFMDSQVESGSPEQPTFNGFKEPLPTEGHPIDWILFRGPLKVESYRVLAQKIDGVLPSDHFPVTATLIMNEGN